MSTWEKFNTTNKVLIDVGGEQIYYDPETGALFSLIMYKKGQLYQDVEVYRTGRNVVKLKVDGASHRAMDAIYQSLHGALFQGFRGYPKNGDFSDLSADNIIMIRTREPLFSQGDEE